MSPLEQRVEWLQQQVKEAKAKVETAPSAIAKAKAQGVLNGLSYALEKVLAAAKAVRPD